MSVKPWVHSCCLERKAHVTSEYSSDLASALSALCGNCHECCPAAPWTPILALHTGTSPGLTPCSPLPHGPLPWAQDARLSWASGLPLSLRETVDLGFPLCGWGGEKAHWLLPFLRDCCPVLLLSSVWTLLLDIICPFCCWKLEEKSAHCYTRMVGSRRLFLFLLIAYARHSCSPDFRCFQIFMSRLPSCRSSSLPFLLGVST